MPQTTAQGGLRAGRVWGSNFEDRDHEPEMATITSMSDSEGRATLGASAAIAPERANADERLRVSVRSHLARVWRVLRRNGVPAADVDDAVQKVFLVLSRKAHAVEPGRELPFLLRTAVFVASEPRRTQCRRRESKESSFDERSSEQSNPEHELLEPERLSQLDGILKQMDDPLRVAFVLYELEELTMAAIAEILEVPIGTVASRLRRARARFEELAGVFRDAGGGQR
jgi:RNA polymerase sigma-70 factor, ECF subfamily